MGGKLIDLDEARRRVLEAVRALPDESVPLAQAAGRVLAESVVAAGDVPPFATSAMDGYAVTAGDAGRELAVGGEARAGSPTAKKVDAGTAIAISTGAPLPDGAEAVIRVEETSREGDLVALAQAVEAGQHVRLAGEDLAAGAEVLRPGTRLGAEELAVAAASGRAELRCAQVPRLAAVMTGDELTPHGAQLGPGAIHDSNGVMVAALTAAAGGAVVSVATAGDDAAATRSALGDAIAAAHVVVSTGGVSVGEHDHVKAALGDLGVDERFWRVALKPGKPVWFGVHGATLVFGLPGNPASAAVCFHLFVAPALRALGGAPPLPWRVVATLTAPTAGARGRLHAVRVALAHDAEGRLVATPTGAQDSHRLASLAGADGLALVPAGTDLEAGDRVDVEPLRAGWPSSGMLSGG
jgi:molybdopterin molybdotransferase